MTPIKNRICVDGVSIDDPAAATALPTHAQSAVQAGLSTPHASASALGREHGLQSEQPDDTPRAHIGTGGNGRHEDREMPMIAADIGTVTVTCARCADGWTATQDQPFFDCLAEAMTYALTVGWHLTSGGLLCPDCSLRASCERAGHAWSKWISVGVSPAGRWPGGRARFCRTCTTGQYDPPLNRPRLPRSVGEGAVDGRAQDAG